jgi:hypothetical protein
VRRYAPVEGTSYFRAEVPPPPGYAHDVLLHCTDGSTMSMPFDAALTVIGQNVHEILGLGPDCSILAHLSTVYKDLTKTPFYKDVFYISARRGDRTVCCVPLDTQPPAVYGAGGRPLFGAPVMGLALPTTVALPVGLDLLGETPEKQNEVHSLLCDQIAEMYSPTTDRMDVLSSFWQPCAPPDALPAPLGAPFYQTECCYAYDHPDHTSMAVAVLRAVADRFNALQAKEPGGDGVVASAFVAVGAYSLTGKPAKGIERNTARAFEMFSYAATEFGDMHAQYNLGLMYLEGSGITKDVRRGARWLRLAADKQHIESQAVLGRLYFNGIEGVPRQRALGLMYLTMARDGAGDPAKHKWIIDLYDGAMTTASDPDRQAALTYLEQFVKGRQEARR